MRIEAVSAPVNESNFLTRRLVTQPKPELKGRNKRIFVVVAQTHWKTRGM
jgi:hypothetical protein